MKRLIPFFVVLLLLSGCDYKPKTTSNVVNDIDDIIATIKNPKATDVIVVSHRGDWRNFPENSLEAIEAVIDMGVDMVEIDLAMTKDSVLILMHDRTIDRTTNGKGKVVDMALDSIMNFRLKTGHGVTTKYQIPTLEEALLLCKNRITINIDKGYDYYDEVHALLVKTGTLKQVLIKGSITSDVVAEKTSKYAENMMYMPIVNFSTQAGYDLLDAYLAGPAPLAYEVCWPELTPKVKDAIKRILDSGAKIWTNSLWASLNGGLEDDAALENPAEIYGGHLELGSTMIQTDRPQLLIEYLQSVGRHK